MNKDEYRLLPGVDIVLQDKACESVITRYGVGRVTETVRVIIEQSRQEIGRGAKAMNADEIIAECDKLLKDKTQSSLHPVINGSGIVLHTNLGRAPLGEKVISDLQDILTGYCNVEFDLHTGKRGKREDHVRSLLQEITGAEDAVVVNNNAAAVMLILKTLAEGKEVIISRGELIEIGGSFRIPDIMAASGAKMVEVGCTNITKLSDYEDAITPDTGLIFKAHKSNYYIGGFSEEVELDDLVALAHDNDLVMVYDIGSGLLRKPEQLDMASEPDVKTAIQSGVDLLCFSGDKLLGGPQAGIITGKQEYVQQIAKAPMMRALRVGKMTISALISVMQAYLNDNELIASIPIFQLLNRKLSEKQALAEKLIGYLEEAGIRATIVESYGRCGGGTMPELKIDSIAVQIVFDHPDMAEVVHQQLLLGEKPVLGILREGELLFDLTSLMESDLPVIAEQLAIAINNL
ncbi:MAG: L-seryl-tRNA(Sec) selenium transferase [Candidatus Stygibacter australis]|nr:L-seryl-tRNA(Sec) selenium transferase [Candidatus Stygibacter australis]MDP8323137.1 L-seryl-tRNA(Sec) selenium transferase [Candidatus Stygibacter australis]